MREKTRGYFTDGRLQNSAPSGTGFLGLQVALRIRHPKVQPNSRTAQPSSRAPRLLRATNHWLASARRHIEALFWCASVRVTL